MLPIPAVAGGANHRQIPEADCLNDATLALVE